MDKIKVWVSYFLQDGTQTGATLEVDAEMPAQDIDRQLMAKHGAMYGDVADWGEYEEDDEDAKDTVLVEVTYRSEDDDYISYRMATLQVMEGYGTDDIIEALKGYGEKVHDIISIEEYDDVTDEDDGNAGCDNAGFCTGPSCKYYYTRCHA